MAPKAYCMLSDKGCYSDPSKSKHWKLYFSTGTLYCLLNRNTRESLGRISKKLWKRSPISSRCQNTSRLLKLPFVFLKLGKKQQYAFYFLTVKDGLKVRVHNLPGIQSFANQYSPLFLAENDDQWRISDCINELINHLTCILSSPMLSSLPRSSRIWIPGNFSFSKESSNRCSCSSVNAVRRLGRV